MRKTVGGRRAPHTRHGGRHVPPPKAGCGGETRMERVPRGGRNSLTSVVVITRRSLVRRTPSGQAVRGVASDSSTAADGRGGGEDRALRRRATNGPSALKEGAHGEPWVPPWSLHSASRR